MRGGEGGEGGEGGGLGGAGGGSGAQLSACSEGWQPPGSVTILQHV